MANKLFQATKFYGELLEQGYESPDAEFKASQKFGVKGSDILSQHDAIHATASRLASELFAKINRR